MDGRRAQSRCRAVVAEPPGPATPLAPSDNKLGAAGAGHACGGGRDGGETLAASIHAGMHACGPSGEHQQRSRVSVAGR